MTDKEGSIESAWSAWSIECLKCLELWRRFTPAFINRQNSTALGTPSILGTLGTNKAV